MSAYHLRWMVFRDIPEVLDIERKSFESAWSEGELCRVIRNRNRIGMVIEGRKGQVVGYMIYELQQRRIDIINFAVHPAYRRRGVGTAMVEKLKSKLGNGLRRELTLVVRETNLEAQLFFRSAQFFACKVLKSFYEDSTEDAYLMRYDLAQEEAVEVCPRNRVW